MDQTRSLRAGLLKRRAARLASAAGREPATGAAGQMVEQLEPSIVLAGDQVYLGDFMNATILTPDGQGEAVRAGVLEVAGDDDMFAFVMPNIAGAETEDFVTVIADAINSPGTLDTRVTVYDSSLNVLGSGSTVGPISSGPESTDGWFGFVATEGETYFIQVASDQATGTDATGDYRVRIDAQSTSLPVDATTGFANIPGATDRRNDDIVFRLDTPAANQFNSLIGINVVVADTPPITLDARLDIFDRNGSQIAGDSQTGRQVNPFVVFEGQRNGTFYVRVRSDEIGPISQVPSFGVFDIIVDAAATQLPLDQARRDAQLVDTALQGVSGAPGDLVQFELVSFVSERTGRTRLDLRSAAQPAMPGTSLTDPALRLYADDATLIGFNDDVFIGGNTQARIIQTLQGGLTYTAVLDNFNDVGLTGINNYDLSVETGIVSETGPALDDHATGNDFDNATALVWGPAVQAQAVDLALTGGLPGGTFYDPVTDHSEVTTALASGLLTPGDSDLFVFTPPVDVLGQYAGLFQDADMDPSTPDVLVNRPSSRLEIVLEPDVAISSMIQPDPYGLNPSVFPPSPIARLFDSNGTLVAEINGDLATIQNDMSPFNGRPLATSAARDGSLYGDTLGGTTDLGGIRVWGGEAYFLQVLNVGTEGRYNLRVTTDAFPDPTDPNNIDPNAAQQTLDGVYSVLLEQPDAGQLIDSLQYQINASAITGDARLSDRTNANGFFGFTNPSNASLALYERAIGYQGGNINGNNIPAPFGTMFTGALNDTVLVQEGGLGAIEDPRDTDVYFFTATQTGPIEVRIQTAGISDFFNETIIEAAEFDDDNDPMTPPIIIDSITGTTSETRTYNSLLDSALKVFDSDQTLVAQNDDNGLINGLTETQSVGSLGDFTFNRRDARVVFEAQQGVTYFIQVESGQAEAFAAHQNDATVPVAWKHLIGSYDILINGLPSDPTSIASGDDHANFTSAAADADVASVIDIPADGVGTIGGRIRDVAGGAQQNANDTDGFVFFAPTTGQYTVTMQRRPTAEGGGNLVVSLAAFEEEQGSAFVTAVDNGAGTASIIFTAAKGDSYFFLADGQGVGGTDGFYDITVTGPPLADDHADFEDQVRLGTEIELRDFLTSATVTGELENPGDTDVFTLDALQYDDITVTVTPTDASLLPTFTVYELQVMPDGSAVFAQVARGADDFGSASTTRNFGVTPTRLSGTTSLAYPTYFIVVSSEDTDESFGRYQVTVDYTNTDDHSDESDLNVTDALVFETAVPLNPATGFGSATGVKEIVVDTDVFSFVATASGMASVDVDATDRNFLPAFRVLNRNAVEISTTFVDGGDQLTTASFEVTRGETYYVSVGFSQFAIGNERRGSYQIDIQAPPVDDHANAGELAIATVINISADSGDGQIGNNNPNNPANPRIDPAGDTDLFTFTPLAKGDTTIVFTPFFDSGMPVQARITLLSPNGVALQTISAGVAGQAATLSLPGLGVRQFYILVEDVSGTRTGGYTLSIDGPSPNVDPDGGSDGGGDTDADDVDFASPFILNLDPRTGDGSRTGSIGVPGDRDLFIFSPASPGLTYVQVVTPDGSTLDASVTILQFADESPQSVIRVDADGTPGATASTQFNARNNISYYAIVDGIGTGVGEYTLRVNAQPVTSTLFLPDAGTEAGRLSNLAITNPNDFDVSYRVWLRYADGTTEVVRNSTVSGQNQTLIQLSNPAGQSAVGAKVDVPYSIEIWSDGQLAASVISYDGRADTGSQLTETLAPTWDFARVERRPGVASDTVTVFNPNSVAVDITLTGYQSGTTTSVVRRVEALQRTSWSINNLTSFPTGVFSARVSAVAANPAQAGKVRGVVAGLRSENLAEQSGFGVLGNADINATSGTLGSLENGSAVNAELVVFNPGDTEITFQFTGDYTSDTLPDAQRIFNVAARSQVVLTGAEIGLAANQPAGISYTASGAVSVVAVENRLGEANARGGQTTGVTQLAFAGASLNTATLGTQSFGWLNLHNPTTADGRATVQIFFADGTTASFRPFIAAGDFVSIDLAARPEIADRAGIPRFGINVFAPVQITASLTQYDLALGGGWTIAGTPFGLTNSISSVQA